MVKKKKIRKFKVVIKREGDNYNVFVDKIYIGQYRKTIHKFVEDLHTIFIDSKTEAGQVYMRYNIFDKVTGYSKDNVKNKLRMNLILLRDLA